MPLFGRANWKKNGLTSLGYNGPVNRPTAAPKRWTMKQYFPRAPVFSRLPGAPPTRRNNATVLRDPQVNYNRMLEMNGSTNSYASPRGLRSPMSGQFLGSNGSGSGGPSYYNGRGNSSGGLSSSTGLVSPIAELSPKGVNVANGRVSPRRNNNGTRRGRNNRSLHGNNNLEGLRILERQNNNAFFDDRLSPEITAHPMSPSPLRNFNSSGGISSSGGRNWASPRSGSASNTTI